MVGDLPAEHQKAKVLTTPGGASLNYTNDNLIPSNLLSTPTKLLSTIWFAIILRN